DVRLVAGGQAAQRAQEVERELDRAEAMLRLLFNDVQSLKDGRHPQGEQMYRRYGDPQGQLGTPRWGAQGLGPTPGCGSSPRPMSPVSPVLTKTPVAPVPPMSPVSPVPPMLLWPQCPLCPPCSLRSPRPSCPPFPHTRNVPSTPNVPCAPCASCTPVPPHTLNVPIPLCPPHQNASKARLRHLESLHSFVGAATKELLWLSEREEEEVAFDWSHRNPAVAAKKDSYS
ncbi:PLEC protein, partial [Syrrhaptes paradoxus]|nr:PLEC protein [Syrrhaptes paradoxus]